MRVTSIFFFSHNVFCCIENVLSFKLHLFCRLQILSNKLTLSRMTNFKLKKSLQTTLSGLMKMAKKVLQKDRQHCRERNYSLLAISPLSTVFSKELYCRHVKTRACLGRVKSKILLFGKKLVEGKEILLYLFNSLPYDNF